MSFYRSSRMRQSIESWSQIRAKGFARFALEAVFDFAPRMAFFVLLASEWLDEPIFRPPYQITKFGVAAVLVGLMTAAMQ